jgi:hypothetical protein
MFHRHKQHRTFPSVDSSSWSQIQEFTIIILVTKDLFAVPSSFPFSLKHYIIDIVRNVGQQNTSGST